MCLLHVGQCIRCTRRTVRELELCEGGLLGNICVRGTEESVMSNLYFNKYKGTRVAPFLSVAAVLEHVVEDNVCIQCRSETTMVTYGSNACVCQ